MIFNGLVRLKFKHWIVVIFWLFLNRINLVTFFKYFLTSMRLVDLCSIVCLGMCKGIYFVESTDNPSFCDAWTVTCSIGTASTKALDDRASKYRRLWNIQFAEQFFEYDEHNGRRSVNGHQCASQTIIISEHIDYCLHWAGLQQIRAIFHINLSHNDCI